MRFSVMLFSVLFTAISYSQELPLYYGSQFLSGYQDRSLTNDNLKNALFTILSGGHIKVDHAPDQIVTSCTTSNLESTEVKCVQHQALGYDPARTKLFGQLFLKQLENGTYSVKDVYCERVYTDADFGGALTFGPNKLPSQGNLINTEHTWPQARFTGRFPKEMQKSDLHHLFPTNSEANSHRGSLHFGNVVDSMEPQKCQQTKLGTQANAPGPVFEVPDSQKGNTARAIFYFATRYQMKVSPAEEAALREWNKKDPVDAEEFERNNQIEALQGNRNPYVDFPELVDRIDHF